MSITNINLLLLKAFIVRIMSLMSQIFTHIFTRIQFWLRNIEGQICLEQGVENIYKLIVTNIYRHFEKNWVWITQHRGTNLIGNESRKYISLLSQIFTDILIRIEFLITQHWGTNLIGRESRIYIYINLLSQTFTNILIRIEFWLHNTEGQI